MPDPDPAAERPAARRRRFAPTPALAAGLVATCALALSTSDTLAAFTAEITNSSSTVTAGTLVMTYSQGTSATPATCKSDSGGITGNSVVCTTVNAYGGSITLTPGATTTGTVTVQNTGTVPGTFSLTPGLCVQSGTGPATDLCNQLELTIARTSAPAATIGPASTKLSTAASTGALALGTLAAGGTATFTFAVAMPSSLDNRYQGLTATQPITWNFSA